MRKTGKAWVLVSYCVSWHQLLRRTRVLHINFATLPRADALVCTPTFIVGARFMVPVAWQQCYAADGSLVCFAGASVPQDHLMPIDSAPIASGN